MRKCNIQYTCTWASGRGAVARGGSGAGADSALNRSLAGAKAGDLRCMNRARARASRTQHELISDRHELVVIAPGRLQALCMLACSGSAVQ